MKLNPKLTFLHKLVFLFFFSIFLSSGFMYFTNGYNFDSECKKDFKLYSIPTIFVENGGYLDKDLQQGIQNICDKYGIDYALVLAIIEIESGYRNYEVSDCGAIGYMQVIPDWHKDRINRLDSNVYDPIGNVIVGVDYFSELYSKYKDVHHALMAYNMGQNGADKLWDKGVRSTSYSRAIVNRANIIKGIMGVEK